MDDLFKAAQTELVAMIERIGVGSWEPGHLREFVWSQGIFGTALCHAVHEMLWTGVAGGATEETLTASLMGHLATNINWYALMTSWSDPLSDEEAHRRQCDVYWAEQPRQTERLRGADFGIARRVSDRQLRIALFQAKKWDVTSRRANLYRGMKLDRDGADAGLRRMLRRGYSDWDFLRGAHQVEKLVRWWGGSVGPTYGPELAERPNWCRYVFWPSLGVGGPGACCS